MLTDFNQIPQELRNRRQWVCWKLIEKEGDLPKKLPTTITGKPASSTDPQTWSSFDEALSASSRFSGLGFVFSGDDPFCGIDFDGCRNPQTGEIATWAKDWIKKLNSYSEVSPSQTGVKVWVRAKFKLPTGKKRAVDEPEFVEGKKPGVEVYDHARYFCVTGQRLSGLLVEPEERHSVVDELADAYFQQRKQSSELNTNLSVIERARRYISTIPAAVSGSGGHNATFHVACILVLDFELSPSEALILLSEYNQRCEPPWTEKELVHKIESANQQSGERGRLRKARSEEWEKRKGYLDRASEAYTPRKEGRGVAESDTERNGGAPHQEPDEAADERAAIQEESTIRCPRTDTGNGELIGRLNGRKVRFNHRTVEWKIFREHVWSPDNNGEVNRLAIKAARSRYREAEGISNPDDRGKEAQWAIASESRQRLDAALSIAKSLAPIADTGENWDENHWLLGTENGVIDLRTGSLRDGRPEDLISKHVNAKFDPQGRCDRWERFIAEIFNEDRELIDFVHRAVGYSIQGTITKQVMFVNFGTGGNGKGVFSNTLLTVFGQYGHNLPFSTLEFNQKQGIPADLADLPGKRFVIASESNDGQRLNEARVKMLVHGDPITARHLYGKYFTFQPSAKLWLSVNHKPTVKDDSYGFWRSVLLIPFERRFEKDANENLISELLEERDGILAWAVRGCREWHENGLNPPSNVTNATKEYKAESDPLTDFIEDRCESNETSSAMSSVLYQEYLDWARKEGIREKEIMSHTKFGRNMATRFKKDKSSGIWYRGIGLKAVPREG